LRTSNSQGSLKRIIKRGPLANAKVTIETLPSMRAQRMAELGARCRQKQLQHFLESHRIEDAVLPNIGKGRKQLLRVYNIEDASDVEPSRINGIKGFGSTMQNTLLAWRASIEQRFRFDPNRGIDPEDLRQLEQELQQKRAESIRALMAGPNSSRGRYNNGTLEPSSVKPSLWMPRNASLKHRSMLARSGTGIGESNTLRFSLSSRFLRLSFFGSGHEAFQPNRISYGVPEREGLGCSIRTRFEPREPRILMSARPTSEGPSVMPHGPQETFGPLSRIPGSSNCNKCETGASQTARTIMKRTI
jgi:hypothetical protein